MNIAKTEQYEHHYAHHYQNARHEYESSKFRN